MAAYIGKISALVTASTADLQRKLQGSAKEVDRFGGQLQRIISSASRSAQNSLGAIFTPIQRIQRALEVGRDARLGLVSSKQVEQIQRAVSVAEGINKPLAAATKQFSRLSSGVQAQFLPALDEAQRRVGGLNDLLERSGNVSEKAFTKTAERVDRVTASLSRLNEIQRIVASAPAGNELVFDDPKTSAQLQRNAALRQQAATLPAASLADGSIAQQVRELALLDQSIAESRAKLEAVRIKVNVDSSEVAIAQQSLDNAVAAAERAASRLEEDIRVAVDTSEADAVAAAIEQITRAVKLADEKFASLSRAIEGTFAGLPQTVAEAETEFRKLLNEIGELESTDRDLFRPTVDSLAELFKEAELGVAGLEDIIQALQKLKGIQQQQAASSRLTTASGKLGIISQSDIDEDNERQRQAARGRRTADTTARLGPSLDDPLRQLDSLVGRVTGLKNQLDKLPASVRAQFLPALKAAEQELIRISTAGTATPVQIKRAADEVRRLEAAANRAATALAIPTFREFIGNVSTKKAQGELEALRQILARTGAEAGGPAAQAYDKLAAATAKAIASGTAGLPQVRKQLEQLQVQAAKAAAATGKISFGAALAQIKRGGDVATKSFQNVGLAINQLLFGLDDFFSVTGSAEQRIRAVGNNITQFGVIVGQTTGLVVALAAVLAAQGLAAYVRFANGGTEAQDRTKALNDALATQKSLVEDLARAFESVGDAIARTGFSKQTQDLKDRQRILDDIRKKSQAEQRERVAGLDPDVQRERGIQAARQRELDQASDVGERVRLTRLIRASQRREEEATARALSRPGIGPQQAVRAAADARFRIREIQINEAARRAGQATGPGANLQDIERQRQRQIEQAQRERDDFVRAQGQAVAGLRDPREQQRAATRIIDEEIQRISESRTTGLFGFFDGAANTERLRQIEQLEAARTQIEKDVFRNAANALAVEITGTTLEAAARIGAAQELLAEAIGDGAAVTQFELDALAQKLASATAQLDTLRQEGNVESLEAAQRQVDAIFQEIDARASVASSLATFSEALDRVSTELANTVAGEARSLADQARRDANRAAGLAGAGRGPAEEADFRARRRDELEADARRAEERRDEIQRDNAARRDAFEGQARQGALGRDAQRLVAERDAIDALLRGDIAGSNEDRVRARRRREEIDAELGRRFEDSPAGRAAREQADAADREAAARRQQAEDIERGRELLRSPVQREFDGFLERSRQIQAAVDEARRAVIADPDNAAAREEFDRLRRRQPEAIAEEFDSLARRGAPAILGLADSVANAVLQGPSRAALNVADISTAEGARELNRLLRGDDPARDQNLVELRTQSKYLEELVQLARDNNIPIAN